MGQILRAEFQQGKNCRIHQPSTTSKGRRERIEDVDSRYEPFAGSFIAVLRLLEGGKFPSKDGEHSIG